MNTYSKKVNKEEVVIFCDENGEPTGQVGPKLDSHNANTKMHLAFSVYVFNDRGEILVTQRAHSKKVWHGVWSNTCCGHLALGEITVDAIKRRLAHELGMTAKDFQEIIPNYTYITPPYDGVVDHEYCPVFVAIASSEPVRNPDEVEELEWISWNKYISELDSDSDDYSLFADHVPKDSQLGHDNIPKWSWWCKNQLKQLKENDKFKEFLNSIST